MSNIDLSRLVTAEAKAALQQAGRRAGVNAERDRRLYAGVNVTVAGAGDIPVQGGPGDQINLIALDATARSMADAGVTAAIVPFRDGANVVHDLTPAQVIELARGGKEAASAIYAASWALKDSGDIPADYADDEHWP